MGIFGKEKVELPKMATRADAFAYMLTVRMDSGDDAMEAARKANEFADIFARNMGLPDQPQPEGVDKYIGMADKVVKYCSDHPQVLDIVGGAFSALLGVFAANKADSTTPPPPPVTHEPIDFENLT